MGYQALLFCSDEKTARLVTQVLSELEFSVESSNEPFAAVKRLTTQHFDAIIVDCDNEQNAALLFKSARNSGPNRASLAVAVVEGQPGIAKAFRIGANLVLTKPINVEQSKGTLRVARGLLKKPDGAKPANLSAPVPEPPLPTARPLSMNPSAAPRSLTPMPPMVKPMFTPPPAAPVAAPPSSVLEVEQEPVPLPEPADAALLESMPDPVAPPPAVPAHTKGSPWQPVKGPRPFASSGGEAAAVAPAPIKETSNPGAGTLRPRPEKSTLAPISEQPLRNLDEPSKPQPLARRPAAHEAPVAPPTFGSHPEQASGRSSRKILLVVLLLVMAAAGGYLGWTKFLANKPAPAPVSAPAPKPAPTQIQATPPQSSAVTPAGPDATTPAPGASDQASPADQQPAQDIVLSTAPSTPPDPKPQAPPPVQKPAHVAIVVKNSTAKPAHSEASSQAPPVVGMEAGQNDKALSGIVNMPTSGAKPVLQTLRVSQGVSQGLLVKKIQPEYPAQAKQLRIEGAVQLLANIAKDGNVAQIKVLGGHPILARAATEAVKQWKYKPYMLNGQAVEFETQITINFKLP